MIATFGKLQNSKLSLSPGLNIIYAPNESGKSTWVHFIRAMFFGLNHRDRHAMADKNRFAPWDGSRMQGRMELDDNHIRYILTRTTQRSTAPLDVFSCTYAGTAAPADGIDAQNCGEHFWGMSQAVFRRSVFIGQNALSVDHHSDLEQRIVSLITTGDEDVSYSSTYGALKAQANRRMSNSKTGMIPRLERTVDALQQNLSASLALESQVTATHQQLDDIHLRIAALQQEDAHRRSAQQQARLAQAQADAVSAAQEAAQLRKACGPVPAAEKLQRMEADFDALIDSESRLQKLSSDIRLKGAALENTRSACEASPLSHGAEAKPNRPRLLIVGALVGILAAFPLAYGILQSRLPFIFAAAICVCLSLSIITYSIISRKNSSPYISTGSSEQNPDSLLLHQRVQEADAQYRLLCRRLEEQRCLRQEQYDALALLLQPCTDTELSDLHSMHAAISRLRNQRTAIDEAQLRMRDTALRRDILQEELRELSGASAVFVSPQLQLVQEQERQIRSRLDSLLGRLQSIGHSGDYQEQLLSAQQQLSRCREEYDALVLAMDALNRANTILQNRFAPELGARTAAIFSRITHGRYNKVLLDRNFTLSAELLGDPIPHGLHYLSRGAADQLYLSLRMAICDVLRTGNSSVPLILDDALVSFDDERLQETLDYLAEAAQQRQILLFTCQKREQQYLAGRPNVHFLSL